MLAGIYYGAMYGGSTTSILVNIPGEPPPSLPAWTDTRWPARGGPGPALGIAAFGSFIAGTFTIVALIVSWRRRWPSGPAIRPARILFPHAPG